MGDADCGLVACFFFTLPMPLDLNIDVLGAEYPDKALYSLSSGFFTSISQRGGKWSFNSSSKAHQATRILFEVGDLGRTLLFGHLSHLKTSNHLTQVLIALASLTKQRQAGRLGNVLFWQPRRRFEPIPESLHRALGVNVRTYVVLHGDLMESCRAIEAVAIKQSHCRHLQFECPLRYSLR